MRPAMLQPIGAKTNTLPYCLALYVLSALLVGLGIPSWVPLLCPIAAAVGYALAWLSIFRLTTRRSTQFWLATLWSTTVLLIQISWMTAHTYQGIYIFAVWIGFSVFFSLFFGWFSLFMQKEIHSPWAPLAFAGIWTFFEQGKVTSFLCAWSLTPAGLPLSSSRLSLQSASVWGLLGMTFVVIWTNLAIYRFFALRQGRRQALFSLFTPYLVGFLALQFIPSEIRSPLSVTLVQTAILPDQRARYSEKKDRFIPLLEQWRKILAPLALTARPDLLILPECVVSGGSNRLVHNREKASQLIVSIFGQQALAHIPVVDGEMVTNLFFAKFLSSYYQTEVIIGLDFEGGVDDHFNSSFFVRPSGEISRYDKVKLVPAEYFPYQWGRHIAKKYGIHSFFTPGRLGVVFDGDSRTFVPTICYDEMFSDVSRLGRLAGGEILINQTNDSWFYPSRLPLYHFSLGKIRAVEAGAPLIRACNTGVTAVVDAYGQVISQIGSCSRSVQDSRAVLSVTFSPNIRKTPYLIWGDKGILALAIFVAGLWGIKRKQNLTRGS